MKQYKLKESKYNLIKTENINYMEENKKLLESLKKKEKDYEKIKSINEENKNNFDNIIIYWINIIT